MSIPPLVHPSELHACPSQWTTDQPECTPESSSYPESGIFVLAIPWLAGSILLGYKVWLHNCQPQTLILKSGPLLHPEQYLSASPLFGVLLLRPLIALYHHRLKGFGDSFFFLVFKNLATYMTIRKNFIQSSIIRSMHEKSPWSESNSFNWHQGRDLAKSLDSWIFIVSSWIPWTTRIGMLRINGKESQCIASRNKCVFSVTSLL